MNIAAVDETPQPNQVGAVFKNAERSWILALHEVRAARAVRPGSEGLLIDGGAELHYMCVLQVFMKNVLCYEELENLCRSLESRCIISASDM